MRMKQVNALVVGMLLASTAVAEEVKPFEPDFSKMTEIRVRFEKWTGRFAHSGMARLQRVEGSSHSEFWDLAEAPEGSFSLEEIYSLVAPHLKPIPIPDSAECLSVAFYWGNPHVPGTRPPAYFYIEDKRVMRKLMYGLRDKVFPSFNNGHKAFFEGQLSAYPLVPGDKPTPFVYSDKARRIAEKKALEQEMRETRMFIKKKRAENGLAVASPEEEERIVDEEFTRWKTENGVLDIAEDETPAPLRRPWFYRPPTSPRKQVRRKPPNGCVDASKISVRSRSGAEAANPSADSTAVSSPSSALASRSGLCVGK